MPPRRNPGGQLDSGQSRLVQRLDGTASRARLDDGPELVGLLQVVDLDGGGEVAAPRQVRDLPLPFERPQGLAHRGDARAQPPRNLL